MKKWVGTATDPTIGGVGPDKDLNGGAARQERCSKPERFVGWEHRNKEVEAYGSTSNVKVTYATDNIQTMKGEMEVQPCTGQH